MAVLGLLGSWPAFISLFSSSAETVSFMYSKILFF